MVQGLFCKVYSSLARQEIQHFAGIGSFIAMFTNTCQWTIFRAGLNHLLCAMCGTRNKEIRIKFKYPEWNVVLCASPCFEICHKTAFVWAS